MRDIFAQAGQAAWGHILAPAVLAELSAPDRWDPRSGADVLVAEHAGKVVGFVCLRASADDDAEPTIGEIDGFYVLLSVVWARHSSLQVWSVWLHPASRKQRSGQSTETIGPCGSTAPADGNSMVASGAVPTEAANCWNCVTG
jgi:hypothetical protein